MTDISFPAAAYAPNGQLWWRLKNHPGTRRAFGAEHKIAAWLRINKPVGSTFTMKEIRAALGETDAPNAAEHLNRRVRQLRKFEWSIPSAQEDASLKPDEYRVVKVGWYPGDGPKPKTTGNIGAATRRQVFKRDGYRCVICGVGRGEEYPDPPHGPAVITVGHRTAQDFGGSDDLDNLQTECKRCNEPLRQAGGLPETLDEVYASIKGLRRDERATILRWLRHQRRSRSRLDIAYDRARQLSWEDREALVARLEKSTGA